MAMSDEHKAALAEGRQQARAIKGYLEALGGRRPGRPVTPESLRSKLARIEARIDAEADPLRRVDLVQQRLDTLQSLREAQATADISGLETGFADNALAYSQRKGISYAAWREAGVPAVVLKSAGISRRG